MNADRRHPRDLKRAALGLLLSTAALLGALTVPAGAAKPPGPGRPTTTTTSSSTTSSSSSTTSSSSSTTTTIAPTSPCGPTVLKGDGTPWQCTFADSFDGTTLDRTKWLPQQTALSNYGAGGECFVDDPDNVSVQDGTLRLTVREEAAAFTCKAPKGDYTTRYTSGSVSTHLRFSQTYGRFEVRAKFPDVTVKGLQEAIWLWPDNPFKYGLWPYSGEIDIAEVYHLYYDRAIPYIHYVPDPWWDPTVTNNWCLVQNVWDYHTYVAEWTPERITISFDGNVCVDHVINPSAPLVEPQPFDHPFMIALTQALGVGDNAFDPETTPLPATTTVDHVRVWK